MGQIIWFCLVCIGSLYFTTEGTDPVNPWAENYIEARALAIEHKRPYFILFQKEHCPDSEQWNANFDDLQNHSLAWLSRWRILMDRLLKLIMRLKNHRVYLFSLPKEVCWGSMQKFWKRTKLYLFCEKLKLSKTNAILRLILLQLAMHRPPN